MNRHQAIALLTASGQPMELIQSELYGVPCRRYKNAPQTLRQLFEDNLSELPFIVFAEERYSFQQTWHKVVYHNSPALKLLIKMTPIRLVL